MRIALSSREMSTKCLLFPSFGRAPYYAIYDDQAKKWQFLPNSGAEKESGAGIKAAQLLVEEKVDIVITGRLGPKASSVLTAAGIKVFLLPELPLYEALEKFKKGECQEMHGSHHASEGNLEKAERGKRTEGISADEKVAVATEGDMVAKHFGRCSHYTIVEIREGSIINKELLPNPGHEPGYLPRFLGKKGINTIITGGMGGRAQELFAERGIKVILGADKSVDEIIDSYLAGELKGGTSLCEHGAGGWNNC